MIVNTSVQNTEVIGDISQNSVTIDPKNINHIIQILSSNLYSNPIRSFLREIVSNAYDSHIEAGSEEPIIITITRNHVAIRDYGTGISPGRFREIYLCIGSSTKRESNEYLGYFGIGRFSALACSDIVNITNFYEGKKYCYVMVKDTNSLRIDSLGVFDTDEANGVDVRIPIVNPNSFIDELDVLNFFPNIYINSFDSVFNEREITEYRTFKHSSYHSYNKNGGLSILIGNVMYGIDSSFFKIKYEFLDALKKISIISEIGKVDITPNREQIIYSKSTISYIQSLIDECTKELEEMVKSQNSKVYDSLLSLYNEFNGTSHITFGNDDTVYLYKIYRDTFNYKGTEYTYTEIRYLFGLMHEEVKAVYGSMYRKKTSPLMRILYRENLLRIPESNPKNSRILKKFIEEKYPEYTIISSSSLKDLKGKTKCIVDSGVKEELVKELLQEIEDKIPEEDLYNSKEFKEYKEEDAKEKKLLKKQKLAITSPMILEIISCDTYGVSTRKQTVSNTEHLKQITKRKKVIWYFKNCGEKPEIEIFLRAMRNKNIIAIGISKQSAKSFDIPEEWDPYDTYILNNDKYWEIVSYCSLIRDYTFDIYRLRKMSEYMRYQDRSIVDTYVSYNSKIYTETLMAKRILGSRGINSYVKYIVDKTIEIDKKVREAGPLIDIGGTTALTAFMAMKKKFFNISYKIYKQIKEL